MGFMKGYLRYHHAAALRSLSLPHDRRLLREVQVLEPKCDCLADSKASAAKRPIQQPISPLNRQAHRTPIQHRGHRARAGRVVQGNPSPAPPSSAGCRSRWIRVNAFTW